MSKQRIVAAAAVVGLAVGSGASAREFGVDVSHWQSETGIAQSWWNQLKDGGRSFAYIKATEGLTGPDDRAMAANVQRATAAGLLAGVYHVCHPQNRPTVAGAVLEADHLLAYAGDAIGPGRLRPVLDIEPHAVRLSVSELTDWVLAFCARIVEVRGAAAEPIVYASRSIATHELDARVAGLDLWLAYWTSGVDVNVAQPPPTASWPDPTGQFDNWVLWQYSSTGAFGGISPLDLNVVHSEYMPLSALVIPEPTVVALSGAAILACCRRRVRSARRVSGGTSSRG